MANLFPPVSAALATILAADNTAATFATKTSIAATNATDTTTASNGSAAVAPTPCPSIHFRRYRAVFHHRPLCFLT